MLLRFTKMHGLGNDFMVLDLVSQHAHIQPKHAKQWGDRHTGIGFDQLLIVEAPNNPEVDFRYRIFNADGSEVEQCGNGARCFVRFVLDQGLTDRRQIRVETMSGVITLTAEDDGEITVNMGVPVFDPARVPFESASDAFVQPLDVAGTAVPITAVSMGNPHAVQVVADVDAAPVAQQGPLIESHTRFPARVNAGFVQVVDVHHIRLRVYERGAGETLACGTGACAAVVAGVVRNLLDSPVRVMTRGGELNIRWAGEGEPVYMTGPAVTVFEADIHLE